MRRVFVDTNVFLRFLTRDEPSHAERARRLFEAGIAGELRLETSLLVIAEIVWTLESFYRLPATEVAEKVTTILSTPNLDCPDSALLIEALALHAERSVDFIDAYHAVSLERRGDVAVATFDRKHFKRFPVVELFDL